MNTNQATEANTIAEIAQEATDRSEMIYADTSTDGSLAVHQTVYRDQAGAERVDHSTHEHTLREPHRPRGTSQVRNVESLIALAEILKDREYGSAVAFSDLDRRRITMINNFIGGWGDHRIEYETTPTPEWAAWNAHDDRWMNQAAFAEMLQDLRHTIIDPDAADIVQIARSFTATKTAQFEGGVRLQSGDVQFSYVEDTKASSGGVVEIPETITLNLNLFRDSRSASEVTLEFRYDATPDGLRLGYRIAQKEQLIEDAWDELVDQAKVGLPCQVIDGPAPAPVNALD